MSMAEEDYGCFDASCDLVECKFCKEENLYWEETERGWREEMSMAEEDYGWYDPSLELVECKFCGEENLYWEETAWGWRLFKEEDGAIHGCRGKK